MAFTFSESAEGDTNVSASSISAGALTTGVTSSQVVVGAVTWAEGANNPTISSVKDEANNTYNLVGTRIESTATGTYTQIYWFDAPPGSPKTLTVNLSASTTNIAIYVGVFNRGAAVSVDVQGTHTGSGTSFTGPILSPSGANELVLISCSEDAGTTLTVGTNFTLLKSDTQVIGGSEYWIQTTATNITNSTTTWTTTGSSSWATAGAVFKEGGAVVYIPPRKLVKAYSLNAKILH